VGESKIIAQSQYGMLSIFFPQRIYVKSEKRRFVGKRNIELLFDPSFLYSININRLFTSQLDIFLFKSLFHLKKKLYRALLGISIGFLLKLKVEGIGFKAKMIKISKKDFLCLSIGYNHNINIQVPSNINVKIIKGTSLIVTSNSSHTLNFFGGFLRKFKNVR